MKLVLVTGAGASAEFGRGHRLPMMDGWCNALRNQLGESIADRLGLKQNMPGIEFECAIGQFLRMARALPVVQPFPWIGFANANAAGEQSVSDWFRQAKTLSEQVQAGLFASLHQLYGLEQIDGGSAELGWGALLDHFPQPQIIAAATTNYDLSLELALRRLGLRPYSGEDINYEQGTPNRIHLDDLVGDERRTPLLYLHGRVGWYVTPEGVLVAQPPNAPYLASMGQPALLLPDLEKSYEGTVAQPIWNRFADAIAVTDRVLVVGHSLNDRALVTALKGLSSDHLGVSMYLPTACSEPQDVVSRESERLEGLLGFAPHVIPMRMSSSPMVSPNMWNRFAQQDTRPDPTFDSLVQFDRHP